MTTSNLSFSSDVQDLVIIGSGPAGCTAALYAARAGLKPLLIRGEQPGGQLTITTEVENFPGFTSVQGPDLMQNMEKQAQHWGTELISDRILSVLFNQKGVHTLTGQKTTYHTKAVIIATGASARWLGLESEVTFQGFGVSACATCDGPLFKNKIVAVIGGGNSAAEEALFLARYASHVYLVHRRDALRAEKVLQTRLFQNERITPLWNKTLIEIQGQTMPQKYVEKIRLKDTQTGDESLKEVGGVFIAIGHTPNTHFLKGALSMDDAGYLTPHALTTQTEIPGVFAAGDVRDKVYRQAVTAAGQGCMAALDAGHYLDTLPL